MIIEEKRNLEFFDPALQNFYQQVVRVNCEEFELRFSDLRNAFNAVHAVDAFAAHLFVAAKVLSPTLVCSLKDDIAFREGLAQSSEYFSLLRDIAKAQKHVVLDRGNPRIFDSRETQEKSLGYGEGRWGEVRWGSPL